MVYYTSAPSRSSLPPTRGGSYKHSPHRLQRRRGQPNETLVPRRERRALSRTKVNTSAVGANSLGIARPRSCASHETRQPRLIEAPATSYARTNRQRTFTDPLRRVAVQASTA
jgi:hypothetical protein